MEIVTLSISNWRLAKRFKFEIIDTTVKGKHPLFAPTWQMVQDVKSGQLSTDEYDRLYRLRMSDSWKQYRPQWEDFLKRTDPMAIACYCPAGAHCHRHLLVPMFKQLTERLSIPFTHYGELV